MKKFFLIFFSLLVWQCQIFEAEAPNTPPINNNQPPGGPGSEISTLDNTLNIDSSSIRTRSLFLPLFDTLPDGQPSGLVGSSELVATGVVKERGQLVRYIVHTQKIGYWNEALEMQWNLFHLQSFFYYQEVLGMLNLDTSNSSLLYEPINFLDPFTSYISPQEAIQFWRQVGATTNKSSMGIFTELVPSEDSIRIRYVVPESPSAWGGIKKGDRVLTVNGIAVTGNKTEDFLELTKGPAGTLVNLQVYRNGIVIPVVVIKTPVRFPSVITDTLEGMGYIQVFSFTFETLDKNTSTSSEFRQALLETAGLPVTLLDLRGNGGGSVDEVLAMCDEIVATGYMIQEEYRGIDTLSELPKYIQNPIGATVGGAGEGRKFVLMADSNSASAAEIFTACVTEGAGTPFVGQKTYGKGIGQLVIPTPASGIAKITTAQFYTSTGHAYHKIGLNPDYAVPDSLILETSLFLAKTMLNNSVAKRALPTQSDKSLKIWDFHRRDLETIIEEPFRVIESPF